MTNVHSIFQAPLDRAPGPALTSAPHPEQLRAAEQFVKARRALNRASARKQPTEVLAAETYAAALALLAVVQRTTQRKTYFTLSPPLANFRKSLSAKHLLTALQKHLASLQGIARAAYELDLASYTGQNHHALALLRAGVTSSFQLNTELYTRNAGGIGGKLTFCELTVSIPPSGHLVIRRATDGLVLNRCMKIVAIEAPSRVVSLKKEPS